MPDDQRPIDDSVAEDVLTALAGRECEHSGWILDPRTGHCGDETHTHCAWFCGEAYCGRQFVSWDADNGYSGPDVPLPPQWLGPVADWSDTRKKAAFGDLTLVAAKYT